MTKPKKAHPYYDYRKALSYNCVFNFIVGGRGLGKTYGAKRLGIRNCLNKGEEFIYLRRYKEELKAARDTFFADIEAEFPNHDARLFGNKGQVSPILIRDNSESETEWKARNKNRVWTTACYFVALSVAQGQKSVAFPKVTLVIFDEFIIERATNSGYLKGEVSALLNFYNTVDRGQDKTRVLLLANSVSIMNPYFAEWEIRPDKLPELSTMKDGFILCHFPDSALFATSIYQTRFGKFIAGTEYADYAIGNQFKDANDTLIEDKTSNAKYKYSLETEAGIFSVWYDMSQSTYFVLSKRPGNERLLTLVSETMDKNKIRVSFTEPVLKSLRSAFNRGSVVFDKPSSRNAFVPVFDRK
jgi:hypothetical protein